jgi:PAS domain S-box-containing protein
LALSSTPDRPDHEGGAARLSRRAAAKAASAYALLSGLWVLWSDRVVELLFTDPNVMSTASTIKGWLFVAVTALLLYGLMRRMFDRIVTAAGREVKSQAEKLHALSLLESIADGSEDAIFAKDLEGRYTLFNRAAAAFVGKSVGEVVGKDDRAIFPREQAEMLMAAGRQVMANNSGITQEEELDTPQGRRVFLATKAPLRDAGGKAVGVFGISRDITARKRAEQELREKLALHEQLSRIAASVPGAIHSYKLDADGHACMPYTTAAVEDLFGLTQQELAQDLSGWAANVHPDDIERMQAKVAEAARDFVPWHDLYRYRHPGKGLRWIEGWSIPQQDDGGSIVWHGFVMDVTERKQAEEALRDREEKLSAIVGHSPSALSLKTPDGRYVLANPNLQQIHRLTEAQIIGKTDFDLYPDAVAQIFRANDELVLRTLGRHSIEETVPVGGESRSYMSHMFPVLGDDGRARFVCRISLDITEGKAAEQALRTSEQRFRDIVEASADWVWEVDALGRYTYASPGVETALGFTPAEILGKTPFDLMPPDEAQRVGAAFAEITSARKPFRDLDNINRRKDGTLRHIQTNGMPILGPGGELIGFRGLDRDVTDQKSAELALRENKDRLRALVNSIPDLVWLKNLEGKYLACNPRFEEFFGAPEEDIVGRTDFDFVPAELADFFRTNDRAAMAAGGPTVNEEEVSFASDGHREILQTIKTPFFDGTGNVVGVLGIARDVTAQKTAEAELRRNNDELQRFNRATVGRELDMIELKQQINAMALELGRKPLFPMHFLNSEDSLETGAMFAGGGERD